MFFIKQTNIFAKWLNKLKDVKGKVSILRRIERMKSGNFGDNRYLGDKLYELKIDVGPGYRVYFIKETDKIIILLFGGDKSTQQNDIKKAKIIYEELQDE